MTSNVFDQLTQIMVRLRDKETGCPWDIEQDFRSILPHTLEEAYEVADAIEREDFDDLKEELGDLLLQVVFHAQMAKEEGLFSIDDVLTELNDKLVRRHPHVFGDENAYAASDVEDIWEAEKAKEKHAEVNKSALDGVTKHLPALLRAQKLQKKAAKTGFEWQSLSGFIDKCHEELDELKEAISACNPDDIEDELGDVLFCFVNLARHLKVNAEESLRKANNKFINRFNKMEYLAQKESKVISDLSVDQMLNLWSQVKQ